MHSLHLIRVYSVQHNASTSIEQSLGMPRLEQCAVVSINRNANRTSVRAYVLQLSPHCDSGRSLITRSAHSYGRMKDGERDLLLVILLVLCAGRWVQISVEGKKRKVR